VQRIPMITASFVVITFVPHNVMDAGTKRRAMPMIHAPKLGG